MTAWQFLSLGYLIVIITGAILLRLPIATKAGESTSFINALFTSTSATCVTGLITYDTNTHWSYFGQGVILSLIQLGGLGFMTFVTVVINMFSKHISLSKQKIFMITAGEEKRAAFRRLLRRILLGTLLFEGLGAAILSIRFIGDFGVGKGIYYGIWHSVSAFCNAGFDLIGGVFGNATFASLTHYATDPLVSLTICALILIGGLGFCVWDDLLENKFRLKKCRLHTKVVLKVTAILIIIPTFLFLLFEWQNPDFGTSSFGNKVLIALFNAISPRTAGFNTVNLSNLTDSSYFLTLILMFIGGSSGSTAGGIKITTLFIIVMGMFSAFRGKEDIEVGKRRVHHSLLTQALAIFVSCLFIVITATLLICAFERTNEAASLQAVLYETFSAMGTVGLTLGITPTLGAASKIVLICLMYAGRVGILTLGLAFGEKKTAAKIKKPVDTLLIG